MIKIAFVAAFAAIAGYGVYANQKTDVMSDLALANIEALADGGEGSGDCYGCAYTICLINKYKSRNSMKKILILFVVLFSLISVERLHTVEDTEQICELLLKNVDAMASGAEIIIGPFCIQTDRTCFVDYDGFFVRGYRQYF